MRMLTDEAILELRQNFINQVSAVKALLSDESKWTKGYTARDANGKGTFADDPNAVCWCLTGAIDKTKTNTGSIDFIVEHVLTDFMPVFIEHHYQRPSFGRIAVWEFNDLERTSYLDVIAFLDFCIKYVNKYNSSTGVSKNDVN